MRMCKSFLLEIFLSSCVLHVSVIKASPVCCFPKQFESLMYAITASTDKARPNPFTAMTSSVLNNGTEFPMLNGTVRTAYDSINKRSYMYVKEPLDTSHDPSAISMNITLIHDYKNNIFYHVLFGVICEKGPINANLFIECIPDGAEVVNEGTLGDTSAPVISYLINVTFAGFDYQAVVSVIHTDNTTRECVPVRMYSTENPPDKDAALVIADVVDFTRGIKDPAIFNPPPCCNNDMRHRDPRTG